MCRAGGAREARLKGSRGLPRQCTTRTHQRRVQPARGVSLLAWALAGKRGGELLSSILEKALRDKVDHISSDGRLENDGVAIRTGGRPAQVDFKVIVQYTRKTTDGRYDAGRGQKIGVVNAFCKNQPHNKCPAWMNQ
ncbi:hypothetical protein ACFWIO_15125 [Streptomyces diastatochromogenes]|uniref:hypothetical protein n=1 Tax=Streptomyces diastatochromogenes TaxID=42236 RepID=UPI00365888B8